MQLHVIETGKFKLDGGAMFGVVPRQLWSKLNPPDENNMCTWSMRCLLIEKNNRLILIDTGMGNKQDEKFRSHFQPHGEDNLQASIRQKGYRPEDITDVLITHFHFDHVGGAVSKDKNGNYVPTFPNATYWTNADHYEWALRPNFREKASFLPENFVPLKDRGVLQFIDVEQDIAWIEGIRLKFMYGHTEAMMVPVIPLDNGKNLAYMADLLPSTGHIRMPYVMSYDIRPLQTLTEKEAFFEKAISEDYYMFLEHDPVNEVCRIHKNEKGRFELAETYLLSDLSEWSD
jgi:glyoxylase-like metal-dependent hydrolase (beta-lactamase superfamily II)